MIFAMTRIDEFPSIRVKAKIKKSKNPEGEINFRRDLYRWNIFAIVCIDEHSIDTSRGENQKI